MCVCSALSACPTMRYTPARHASLQSVIDTMHHIMEHAHCRKIVRIDALLANSHRIASPLVYRAQPQCTQWVDPMSTNRRAAIAPSHHQNMDQWSFDTVSSQAIPSFSTDSMTHPARQSINVSTTINQYLPIISHIPPIESSL